jgi:septum formation inhibitor-activating ATPase MinD
MDRGFAPENLRLIINRFDKKAAVGAKLLNIDDVIDGTGVRLIGIVPMDRRVDFCLPRGEDIPPESELRAAVRRVARRMTGETVRLRL